MNETLRHRLPLLASAQAQKEVTHNEALLAIDRRLQIAVLTFGSMAPPDTPLSGDCHIIGAMPIDDWAGRADAIATFDGFGWQFTTPLTGFVVYLIEAGVLAIYNDGWQATAFPVAALRIGERIVFGASPVSVTSPVGGEVVDVELRASFAALLATLTAQGLINGQ